MAMSRHMVFMWFFIMKRAKVFLHLYPGQTYIWWWTFNYLCSNLILHQYRKREIVFKILIKVKSGDLPDLGPYLMITCTRFLWSGYKEICNTGSQLSLSGDSYSHPLHKSWGLKVREVRMFPWVLKNRFLTWLKFVQINLVFLLKFTLIINSDYEYLN